MKYKTLNEAPLQVQQEYSQWCYEQDEEEVGFREWQEYEKAMSRESLSVDPKQSCGTKKMTFDNVSHTLLLLATAGADSGAAKYGSQNWLQLEDNSMSLSTYLNAVQRHLILYRAGQEHTSDTGVHNLDSIIVGLSVVRDAMLHNKVVDDRTKLTEEQIKTLESIINKELKL